LGDATTNESTVPATASTGERQAALAVIAAEVQVCTKCPLSRTRTRAVPGEGHPDTEVMFVGEAPGQTEDQQGRPFVGRAGDLLVKLLSTLGWRRQEVFITNIVKCRPPGNRDPEPAEIAACAPYLRRQLEVLDPAVVVTLGRFSMGHFRPGERITQIHGTQAPVPDGTGARDALAYALFHPAAALRSAGVEQQSYDDIAGLPRVLTAARERRLAARSGASPATTAPEAAAPSIAAQLAAANAAGAPPNDTGDDAPTLF
jgi:DNA polymerase